MGPNGAGKSTAGSTSPSGSRYRQWCRCRCRSSPRPEASRCHSSRGGRSAAPRTGSGYQFNRITALAYGGMINAFRRDTLGLAR